MKKKAHKKKVIREKKASVYLQYIILGVAVLTLIGSGKIYSGLSKTHVLGASVGPVLLADQGSDESGGGTSGGDGSTGSVGISGGTSSSDGGKGSSNTPSSNSGSNTSGSPQQAGIFNVIPPISSDTKVDCVGPDGQHFTTSFHDCQALNQKWGRSSFNFTPLGNPAPNPSQQNDTPQAQDMPEPSQTPRPSISPNGTLEVQTEGNKGELNLQAQGTQIEIKQEDNGQISIHAHQEGGQEIKLQSNALDQINGALKDKEVEVGTTSANELAITSHDVAAHTSLPITIDPTTHTLAVTTPGGTKDVTVLPDQAVAGILQAQILSNVLSQSSTNSTNSATTVIGLTSTNNQPVFEVQGIKDKRLFGIFPVAFQKTVTVSAQTGQILSTQESPFNIFLESLSF